MTQQQVAEYLNVKQNTYSQYEIGVLNYPIDVLCRLADLYSWITRCVPTKKRRRKK